MHSLCRVQRHPVYSGKRQREQRPAIAKRRLGLAFFFGRFSVPRFAESPWGGRRKLRTSAGRGERLPSGSHAWVPCKSPPHSEACQTPSWRWQLARVLTAATHRLGYSCRAFCRIFWGVIAPKRAHDWAFLTSTLQALHIHLRTLFLAVPFSLTICSAGQLSALRGQPVGRIPLWLP